MSAANYIGYFAHLIKLGKMTEEEANKRLEALFESDIRADEFDKKTINMIHRKEIDEIVDEPFEGVF